MVTAKSPQRIHAVMRFFVIEENVMVFPSLKMVLRIAKTTKNTNKRSTAGMESSAPVTSNSTMMASNPIDKMPCKEREYSKKADSAQRRDVKNNMVVVISLARSAESTILGMA